MNYEIYQDSDGIDPIFIGSFERRPEFRPQVGDHLTIETSQQVYVVNRAEPSNNPDDQKVLYFVSPFVDKSNSQFNIITQDLPPNVPF